MTLAPDLKDQTPLPLKEQVAKVFCACPSLAHLQRLHVSFIHFKPTDYYFYIFLIYIYIYIYMYMYNVCVCVCCVCVLCVSVCLSVCLSVSVSVSVCVCIIFCVIVCIGIGHLDDADEDNGRPRCTPVYDYDHTGVSFKYLKASCTSSLRPHTLVA